MVMACESLGEVLVIRDQHMLNMFRTVQKQHPFTAEAQGNNIAVAARTVGEEGQWIAGELPQIAARKTAGRSRWTGRLAASSRVLFEQDVQVLTSLSVIGRQCQDSAQ